MGLPSEVRELLIARGAVLSLEGTALRVEAPRGSLTSELVEQVGRDRHSLALLLRAEEEGKRLAWPRRRLTPWSWLQDGEGNWRRYLAQADDLGLRRLLGLDRQSLLQIAEVRGWPELQYDDGRLSLRGGEGEWRFVLRPEGFPDSSLPDLAERLRSHGKTK